MSDEGFTVTELWAWIARGEDGDEGVLAFRGADAVWVPLVCADAERIESTRSYAQDMATLAGKPVELRRFLVGEVIETLQPVVPPEPEVYPEGCPHPRAVRVFYPDGRELCPVCGMEMKNGDGEGE